MKKLTALLLAAMLALSLTGCGSLSGIINGLNNGGNASPSASTGVGYAEDGYAEGYLGDTMHTHFFDFTVNSAYTCEEFDGLTASDGYKFLVAEIIIENTTKATQPMFFYDFQVQWDTQPGEDEADAYDFPLYEEVTDENGETDYATISDQQLPTRWDLGIRESRTGILLYAVPAGAKDYSISFQEVFASDSDEDGTNGDLFFVFFSAKAQ